MIGVQQFHTACAFIEVIFEGDAAMPGLDLAAARPETDVDGFGGREDFAESGDVDGLHGDSFGGLVEGAVEGVVEDVGLGLDGAWEAVSGVFVLEL